MIPTKSAVYTDVCEEKGKEYSEYHDYMIKFGVQHNYEITEKVGRGKYADVYSGVHMISSEEVAIKIFKPVKKEKIRREVKIMYELKDCSNIVRIFDMVRDASTKTPAMITEYVNQGDRDIKKICSHFSNDDIKHYILSALKGLDFAHSKGIMHRDIKPHNILISIQDKSVKIWDWGQSEYYKPGQEYSTKVAAQFYKAPELIIGYPYYDYSIDIWALGCVLAELIFQRRPFFAGKSNPDQLLKIAKVLGTKKLNEYVEELKIQIDPSLKDMLGKQSEKAWDTFKTNKNEHFYSDEAIDLLSKMLQFDHTKRITAREAMAHDYFSSIR